MNCEAHGGENVSCQEAGGKRGGRGTEERVVRQRRNERKFSSAPSAAVRSICGQTFASAALAAGAFAGKTNVFAIDSAGLAGLMGRGGM